MRVRWHSRVDVNLRSKTQKLLREELNQLSFPFWNFPRLKAPRQEDPCIIQTTCNATSTSVQDPSTQGLANPWNMLCHKTGLQLKPKTLLLQPLSSQTSWQHIGYRRSNTNTFQFKQFPWLSLLGQIPELQCGRCFIDDFVVVLEDQNEGKIKKTFCASVLCFEVVSLTWMFQFAIACCQVLLFELGVDIVICLESDKPQAALAKQSKPVCKQANRSKKGAPCAEHKNKSIIWNLPLLEPPKSSGNFSTECRTMWGPDPKPLNLGMEPLYHYLKPLCVALSATFENDHATFIRYLEIFIYVPGFRSLPSPPMVMVPPSPCGVVWGGLVLDWVGEC